MAPPHISVVIPCYNQARFLAEAVESVLNQSYRDVEVIVVDDGSTDRVEDVTARYPEVRYIRQINQGVSVARNRGALESRGSYLVFLDSDDRLLPEALETSLKHLQERPDCAFAWGQSRQITVDGSPLPHRLKPHVERDHYRELLRANYIRTPSDVMYRRAAFEAVGGYDKSFRYVEDYDLNLRVTRAFPVYGHGQVINEYRVHHTSMSLNSGSMLVSALTALRHQRSFVKGHRELEEAYEAGFRAWEGLFGGRLCNEVLVNLKTAGRRVEALRGVRLLLQHYPTGLLRFAASTLLRTFSPRNPARVKT